MGTRSSTTRIKFRTGTRYLQIIIPVYLLPQQPELVRMDDAILATCIRFRYPLDAPKELQISIGALHPTHTPPSVLRTNIAAANLFPTEESKTSSLVAIPKHF